MEDPRMGQALVALLCEPPSEGINTMEELLAHILKNKYYWPLIGQFVLSPEVVAMSTFPIIRVINKAKPHEQWVAKLTTEKNELEFINKIYSFEPIKYDQAQLMTDENKLELMEKNQLVKSTIYDQAMRHFVKCEEWGDVNFYQYQFKTIIMERGVEDSSKRIHFLKSKDFYRHGCLKEVIDAVQMCHELGYIHGDIKLENIVYFSDEAGYKLIDFEHTTKFGYPIRMCRTFEYCPPEMAKHILEGGEPLIATTSYVVWCTAVLVLKLFANDDGIIEFNDVDDISILNTIASPGVSFDETIDCIKTSELSNGKKELLKICLQANPYMRGTLKDLADILPPLTTVEFAKGKSYISSEKKRRYIGAKAETIHEFICANLLSVALEPSFAKMRRGDTQTNAAPALLSIDATQLPELFNRDMYFKLAASPATFTLLGDYEFVTILQEIETNSSRFELHKSDPRVVRATTLLQLSLLSMDAVSRAFDCVMISRLAINLDTVPLLQAYDFFPKLKAVQNDVSLLPDHMNDPRMGKALVALLQASIYATACRSKSYITSDNQRNGIVAKVEVIPESDEGDEHNEIPSNVNF
ncbi:Aste57867_15589 [Aphanomyces stellatus]|uniref:Aste57867_15589 protein n=1 Tax=Aphanomyces stellatus TaxID=120398 RepID=A0A485L4F5_9STRA|nr:hypothetical protein As57867_015533 [Aphanomyces stellatus]VFT92391.1 Aste57867_15589 [Aphanomyces stellatus]